jgi:hypothetical protein
MASNLLFFNSELHHFYFGSEFVFREKLCKFHDFFERFVGVTGGDHKIGIAVISNTQVIDDVLNALAVASNHADQMYLIFDKSPDESIQVRLITLLRMKDNFRTKRHGGWVTPSTSAGKPSRRQSPGR